MTNIVKEHLQLKEELKKKMREILIKVEKNLDEKKRTNTVIREIEVEGQEEDKIEKIIKG